MVVCVLPPVPVFIFTAVAPVMLPKVTVWAMALVPIFNAPVPVFSTIDVAPVLLPSVIVFAAASVPMFNAPVPVFKLKAELSSVPKTDGAPGEFPPTNQFVPALTSAIVPDASGKVYVLAAVKSAEVTVPANLAAPPAKGVICNRSCVAVLV